MQNSLYLAGVSDLLSTHEAIFLLDVNMVDGKTLLSPWLITNAAVRTPHHTTLTTSHLEKEKKKNPLSHLCHLGEKWHHALGFVFFGLMCEQVSWSKARTSETLSGPPNLSMSSSKVLRGSSFPSTEILLRRACFISSILAVNRKQRGRWTCNLNRQESQK